MNRIPVSPAWSPRSAWAWSLATTLLASRPAQAEGEIRIAERSASSTCSTWSATSA